MFSQCPWQGLAAPSLGIAAIVKLTNAQLPIFYRLMRRSFLINKQKKEKKKITSGFSLFLLKVSVSK